MLKKNSKIFAIALCMTTMASLYAATPAWAADLKDNNNDGTENVVSAGKNNSTVNIITELNRGEGTFNTLVSVNRNGMTVYAGGDIGELSSNEDFTNINGASITTGTISATSLSLDGVGNVGAALDKKANVADVSNLEAKLKQGIANNEEKINKNTNAIDTLNAGEHIEGSVKNTAKIGCARCK